MLSDLWKKGVHIIAVKCKYDCLNKPNINTQRFTALETGYPFTISFLPADIQHIQKPSPSLFFLIFKTSLFSFVDPCFSRCLIGVLTWNGSNKHRGKRSSSTDVARTHTVKSHMSNERLYRL